MLLTEYACSISKLLEGTPEKEWRGNILCGFSLWKFVIVWFWGELFADASSVTVLEVGVPHLLDGVLFYLMGTGGLKVPVKLFFCLFVVLLIKQIQEITSFKKVQKTNPKPRKSSDGGTAGGISCTPIECNGHMDRCRANIT